MVGTGGSSAVGLGCWTVVSSDTIGMTRDRDRYLVENFVQDCHENTNENNLCKTIDTGGEYL